MDYNDRMMELGLFDALETVSLKKRRRSSMQLLYTSLGMDSELILGPAEETLKKKKKKKQKKKKKGVSGMEDAKEDANEEMQDNAANDNADGTAQSDEGETGQNEEHETVDVDEAKLIRKRWGTLQQNTCQGNCRWSIFQCA